MQQNELEFDGIIFPSALVLHEYRLVFDFEYFSDLAEQNILNQENWKHEQLTNNRTRFP